MQSHFANGWIPREVQWLREDKNARLVKKGLYDIKK